MSDIHITLNGPLKSCSLFFSFNQPSTTEIYTLSLHDALPICIAKHWPHSRSRRPRAWSERREEIGRARLNSSHQIISYAVFCLKKKKNSLNKPQTIINNKYPTNKINKLVENTAPSYLT